MILWYSQYSDENLVDVKPYNESDREQNLTK